MIFADLICGYLFNLRHQRSISRFYNLASPSLKKLPQ
jgi:hypothetical protein